MSSSLTESAEPGATAGAGAADAATFAPAGTFTPATAGTPAAANGHPADAAARAEELAAEVAARNGIRVQALTDPALHHAAADVLQQIWLHPDGVPLPPEMLRAFAFTGNYVGAAFDGDQIVGVACAFRTDHDALHSHIAGVLPSHQGRSIGYLLKLHQRAWALGHGIGQIAWTFDPLIRRNAHFNLIKLGAHAGEYLSDFYGTMTDQVNIGDHTDRLLVQWDLLAHVPGRAMTPRPGATTVLSIGADGDPVVRPGADGDRVLQVPAQVEALRRSDPPLAARWRMALREALAEMARDGHHIVGMDRDSAYITRQKDQT